MQSDVLTDESIEEGIALARVMFAKRGNHSEMHINETDLAAALAVSWKRGYNACFNEYKDRL